MTKHNVTLLIAIGAAVLLGGTCVHSYNQLNRLDQNVSSQWAQVDNAYQRRADLVPNLVETVKGAAAFEKETLERVTEARSHVGQIAAQPGKLAEYQAAQDALGGALSRLLVVAEAYPQLTATQNFRDLQAQLEGTENRISVERMRYNEAARDYNTARASFPTSLVTHLTSRFVARDYFAAKAGASEAPKVKF